MLMKNIISDIYIISPEVREALLQSKLPYNLYLKRRKGLHIVLFRVLNNKNSDNILVYNYIYYPEMFKYCLMFYLTSIRTK